MQDKAEKPDLWAERIFKRIITAVSQYRYVIMGTLIMGLLAYLYMFTNKIPNHDDLRALFHKGTTFASGRWGLWLLSFVFPNVSMPWFNGIISILLLTIGSCMIVGFFEIKMPVLQFLLGGLVVTFPSQIGTFGYMFTAIGYGVAFCLAVGAAVLLCRGKKYGLFAAACLIVSLSIYQSYLAITVSLLLLHLIKAVLDNTGSVKQIMISGLFTILFLAVSLGIYWLSAKLIWALTKTQMGAYANEAVNFHITALPMGIYNAYRYYFEILLKGYRGLFSTAFCRLMHLACLVFALGEWIILGIGCKNKKKLVLLLGLLLLLPFGINCMYLFVSVRSIHALVLFSFVAVYFLPILLIENGRYRKMITAFGRIAHCICLNGMAIAMAVILFCNISTANKTYLKMQLSFENTYAFSSSVITRLQSTEGYTPDSKVAILGVYDVPDFYGEHFYDATGIMGTDILTPTTYSIGDFFTYYMGTTLNLVSEEEKRALMENPLFADMQAYPGYGSIAKIGDVFVIKLSD